MTDGDGLYLGVDVGTSATRVSLVRPDGTAVVASAGYRTVRGEGSRAEQDPAAWTRALATALRRLGGPLGVGAGLGTVTAVGLCGQTPTLVPVDAAGRPVRAALTWQDIRATTEAAELAVRLGDPEPLIGTALPWSAANLPAKLAWLARHEPDTVRQTRWLLQPKDFVGMRLTGRAASDPWSSKGICRVGDGAPAAQVLAACGWPDRACPPIDAAWARRGTVTAAAARRFGLPEGIGVGVGWSDALAQTLAAGCYERRSGFVFSGTSAIVGAPAEGKAMTAERPPLAHHASLLSPRPSSWTFAPRKVGGAKCENTRPASLPGHRGNDLAMTSHRAAAIWKASVPALSPQSHPPLEPRWAGIPGRPFMIAKEKVRLAVPDPS